MKIKPLRQKTPRIEMLPLIDIVFLLLVVFIYTMLSMAIHKGMPVDLPAGRQIETRKETPLSVTIMADETVFINKRRVSADRLADLLRADPGIDSETEVLLFADKLVNYQRLFLVLDRIRQAGLHRISLQAEPEDAP